MRKPNIFLHFPQTTNPVTVCPVCGTNEDAPGVLVPIEGTAEGLHCQALCVHVNCAIATHITQPISANNDVVRNVDPNTRMLYTMTDQP